MFAQINALDRLLLHSAPFTLTPQSLLKLNSLKVLLLYLPRNFRLYLAREQAEVSHGGLNENWDSATAFFDLFNHVGDDNFIDSFFNFNAPLSLN